MAKKITIDVEVNGKMQKATISAKKLRGALDGVEQGYQKAGASAGTYDRRTKGAAQATANGTKEFSKMSQGMGGLVGAYATVAASVFALSAAFNFLKNAADLSAQIQGQEMFAQRTGVSMKLMTQNIQDATGGLVAFKEAAQAAAIGQAAGLSADQLERLGKVAKNAGTILGRDVTDSFNRLTRGAIKAEPELLDELGIIVRIKDASEEYAETIGKSANDLTTFEKSQAVVNAVLAQGETKFQDVGQAVNQVAAFGAKFRDTFKDMAGPIADVANFFAGAFKDSILAVSAVFGILGVSILKNIIPAGPALSSTAEAAKAARKRMKKAAGDESKSAIAGEIKKGNFTKRVLADIEKAAKAKTSRVIDLSRVERAEIQRDLLLIRADQLRTTAEGTNAWNRYFLNIRAQLASTQAEFGKFFGFVRFAGAGIGAVFSKVLAGASFIGIGVMLFELGKQFRQTFLISKELRDAEQGFENLTDQLERQVTEIRKVRNELAPATSELNKFAQLWGVLANYNLAPLRGQLKQLADSLKDNPINDLETPGATAIEDVLRSKDYLDPGATAAIEKYKIETLDDYFQRMSDVEAMVRKLAKEEKELTELQIRDLKQLRSIRKSFEGSDASALPGAQQQILFVKGLNEGLDLVRENLQDLDKAGVTLPIGIDEANQQIGALERNILDAIAAYDTPGGGFRFNELLLQIKDEYPLVLKLLDDGNTRARAANAAFNSVAQAATAFNDAAGKAFTPAESQFTALYNAIDEVTNSTKTMLTQASGLENLTFGSMTGDNITDEQLRAYEDIFRILKDQSGAIGVVDSQTQEVTKKTFEQLTLGELINALLDRRASLVEAELVLIKKRDQLQIAFNNRLPQTASYYKDRLNSELKSNMALNNYKKAQQALNKALENTQNLSKEQEANLRRQVALRRSELYVANELYDLEKKIATEKRALAELGLDQKILQTTQQINAALEKQAGLRQSILNAKIAEEQAAVQDTANDRALTNPFFNKEQFIAQETVRLEEQFLEQKISQAQTEYQNKVKSIGLEFDLLNAKRLQTKFELEKLAKELRAERRFSEADEVDALANSYSTTMARVNSENREAALELAEISYEANVKNTERGLQNARRMVKEMNPLVQVMKDAANAFESSLTDAITTLFKSLGDKTIDTGEKLKEIGRGLIDTILKSVVQKGIVGPLLDKIGLGEGKALEAAMRTGADYHKQKIMEALGYSPTAYQTPTQVGAFHARDFAAEAGQIRDKLNTLGVFEQTTDTTATATIGGSGMATQTSSGPFTLGNGTLVTNSISPESASMIESTPTRPMGGGDSGGLSTAMETLGEKVGGLTMETAGNIAAAGTLLAGLTGNEEAAAALGTITALLQVAQLVRNAFIPVEQTNQALNTTALTANTTALGALTAVVAADVATGPLTRNGGIVSMGTKVSGYAQGGIAKGPNSGYPVEMHGTEAVVPLPNKKSIPVELSGAVGGQQNSVVVNVNMSNDGVTTEDSQNNGQDAAQMGKAISTAVQKELQKQRRAGGMLSPYGAG